ncbi:MAG: cadherin repeat domain-containing protein [Saprospiraceae bacterium]|nr:cadherin repeat domain-containing protein [Saprospiraceae bacterium]
MSELITTANFPYQINFQNAATLPPSGWMRDFGQAFGSRNNPQQGSGFSYGWVSTDGITPLDLSVGGTSNLGNGRNRSVAATGDASVAATLMHMQGNNIHNPPTTNFNGTPIEGFWKIDVPNGWYQVTVRVGDMSAESTVETNHVINVEGVNNVVVFDPGTSASTSTGTALVEVTDGNLLINATGGFNTKINSITIAQGVAPNLPPVLTIANFNVAEDVAVNSTVATASANEAVTFSLEAGTPFMIDANNGEIKLATALDFETTTAYTLNITATDAGNLTDTESITVTVTNVNEQPTVSDANFSVAENANVGTEVGTVTASDPDASTTLQYQITAGNEAGDFAIDENSGSITVAGDIEFSAIPSYVLTVQVSDGEFTAQANINITVEDVIVSNQAPTVDEATFTIAENASVNDVVGQVVASDLDGTIALYEIILGNEADKFQIDASTGQITVKNTLDFETLASYTLTVKVSDNGVPVLNDEASITINVSDVNEAPVVTIADFSLPENQTAGVVATVTSTDPETEPVTYTMEGGTPFSINETGDISLNSVLDFETTASYNLNITATDGTNNVQEEVTVTITNVNENPTVEPATFTIAENAALNTVVGQITASDVDANTTLQFALSGTGASDFAISNTGEITLASALDFEALDSYTLTVQVSDGDLTDEATVNISVSNVNEAPVATIADFSLPEIKLRVWLQL